MAGLFIHENFHTQYLEQNYSTQAKHVRGER